FRVIHTFTGGADGASGSAGRMLLSHGQLYGAVTAGGIYGAGLVFELTPTPVGEWDFRTAACSALLRVNSMEPLTMEAKTALALFTSCLPGKPASGTRE